MKDYFIRVIFGLLTFGIVLAVSHIFKINVPNVLKLILIVGGGWGGWYIYKGNKKEK
jgi:hypothetical protein